MPANKGFFLLKSKLTKAIQQDVLAAARTVVVQAPLFRPSMPSGQFFNYSMTNCGELRWVGDRHGYRYQQLRPHTFKVFPAMPQVIKDLAVEIARETGNDDFYPQSCLINLYRKGEKLGMHQDQTEENLSAPIISISLVDAGIFILGGLLRTDKTKSYSRL